MKEEYQRSFSHVKDFWVTLILITAFFVSIIILGFTLSHNKTTGSVSSISNNQNICTITFQDGKKYSSREYGKGLCLLKVGDSVVLVGK